MNRPKRTPLLIAAAAILVAGAACAVGTATAQAGPGPSPPQAGTSTIRLVYDHLNRSALLVRPPALRGPVPLVVLLHGTGVDGQEEMTRTGFGALAARARFALLVPQSIGRTWNSGHGCCSYEAARKLDDTGFVRAAITAATTRTDVDRRRIYLVGYSNGGKLAYAVACTRRPEFAGLATYGAGPQSACDNAPPLSLFSGYGLADRLEPAAGEPANARGEHPGQARTVGLFLRRDRCGQATITTRIGPLEMVTHHACAAGTVVTAARWSGSTHRFPAPPRVPADAAGAAVMWSFLSGQKV